MQFKITIITGIFFSLISSLSMANPVSKEISPQKTELKLKKKRSPIKRFLSKRLSTNPEKARAYAIWALVLGGLSALAMLLLLAPIQPVVSLYVLSIGAALGGLAMIFGDVLQISEDRKMRRLGRVGWALGLIGVIIATVLYVIAVRAILLFLTG